MRNPVALREKRVLRQLINIRGRLRPNFENVDTEALREANEDWNHLTFDTTEEDMLLDGSSPTLLAALAETLRQPYRTDIRLERRDIEAARTEMAGSIMKLVTDYLLDQCVLDFNFFRGPNRIMEFDKPIDRTVFLDYVPLLRVMAVLERAACKAARLSGEQRSNGGRTTRRSASKGPDHYFSSVSSVFAKYRRDEGVPSPEEVGNEIAKRLLV